MKNRLLNVFVAIVLVFMAALTIQGSIETTEVVSAADLAASKSDEQIIRGDAAKCIWPEANRFSIHKEK